MSNLQNEIDRLQRQIEQTDINTRFYYQPPLRNLMTKLETRGEKIPAELKRLHAQLLNEAIEDLFENMPV